MNRVPALRPDLSSLRSPYSHTESSLLVMLEPSTEAEVYLPAARVVASVFQIPVEEAIEYAVQGENNKYNTVYRMIVVSARNGTFDLNKWRRPNDELIMANKAAFKGNYHKLQIQRNLVRPRNKIIQIKPLDMRQKIKVYITILIY